MKKIIIATVLLILTLSAFALCSSAEDRAPTPSVVSLSISSYPDKTVYGAFEQLDTDGLTLRATFSDGVERIIGGEDIRVSYNRDGCLRVGDSSVMLSYGGRSVYLPVTVNRIAYDLSSLSLEDFSVVYNGEFQSYGRPLHSIVGLDGIALEIELSGGGTGVGIYDISLDFHTDSKDYITPESRVISMTVEPATAEIIWEGISFVYDGRSKSPIAYYTDVRGQRVYPTVSGAATNAGTGYIARASVSDVNYEFKNTSQSYEIRKADIDLSSVVWSKDSFTYDGTKKSITATGLPAGVSIIGYSGDRGTDAGSYTVTALLRWDEKNYNAPATLSHTWEILRADYDMTGIGFRSESFVYDGSTHYPTLIGVMPVGADGIPLEYSFSAGATNVSDGRVTVVVSFHSESGNYNIPEVRYSSVVITPLGISVEWGEDRLSYNGDEQTPYAHAPECGITVSGGAVDVGRYLATARTDNGNYFVANDKKEFTIIKADNFWTVTPADSTCYEGRDIILTGEARFGEITVEYYADRDATVRIEPPTAIGRYYAVLSVSGNDNYGSIASEPIAFDILKIAAVSFIARIDTDRLVAFQRLGSDDIICSVVNNDGSTEEVDSSLVSIIYERGDSLRRGDSAVRLQYMDFVLTLPVEVDYADYDMSEAIWTDNTPIYDGSEKTPSLSGLPDGVSVREYVGGGKVNAGSYKVYAVLDYDSENYNEPEVPCCEFIIKKQSVSTPLITSVYNGRGQSALSDSDKYLVVEGGEYTDAGDYSILLSLTDPDNYSFESGGDRAYAIFRILPITLSVSVGDVKLRLFEELGPVDYVITEGSLMVGDELTVTAYREGREVFVRSDNPNYTLINSPGRLIRLPYPTVRGAMLICSAILFALALLLLILTVLRQRHRIASAFAMLRCRIANKGYKAPLPRPIPEPCGCDIGIAESFDKEIESIDLVIADTEDEELPEDSQPEREIAVIDFEIDAERADTLITDSLARSLINREGEIIYTSGSEREIISVELLSKNFAPGERVDVNRLKEKGLVGEKVAFIKVLGGGCIDKPLMVYANEFSMSAVKMIALTGGQVTKVVTFKDRSGEEKNKNT